MSDFIKKLQNLPEKKKMTIILAVVGIVAVILGYFWVKDALHSVSEIGTAMKSQALPNIDITSQLNAPTTQNTTVAPAVPNLAQMAGWQTYIDSEEKFSLKYPPDWTIENNTDDGQKWISFKGAEGDFEVADLGKVTNSCQTGAQTTEKVLVDDKQIDVCYFINNDTKYWTMDTNTPVSVSATANSPYLSNENTILNIFSTFKFTSTTN